MIGCLLTLGILIALGINIATHGSGAWGFQPGGWFSAMLYGLQLLLASGGLIWLVIHTLQAKGTARFYVLLIALTLSCFAGISFMTTGQQIATSIHNQGLENLVPFLLASSVALVAWGYKVWIDNGIQRPKFIGE